MKNILKIYVAALVYLTCWLGCDAVVTASTEPNWPVVGFTSVASGLQDIVDIQNAADGSGRLFLVSQKGTIRILTNGALLPTPLLDITSRITSHGEQGLLGLAFPPNFATKNCFYIYYCRAGDGATVLSRFQMSPTPNVADGNSEAVLLVTPKPYSNHNGGQLAFGPDGLLYISTGDGGSSGDPHRNSQNLTNRLGKILRINVEGTSPGLPYAIPASNPFATSATNSREILCWGLRNPWRFSFDALTGDLFIGDVGEGQREEINFLPAASISAGANFGWSVKEGTLDYQPQSGITGALVPPAYQYSHSVGYSVTGGIIYRGGNPRLQGFYLFGDFANGKLFAMTHPVAGGQVMMLKDTPYAFSTFGTDEAGEIYFADYYGGSVYRMDALDTLPTPVISPAAGTYTGGVSFKISTDVPGAVVRYTTDGSVPNVTSPVFTAANRIDKFDPFTLKAVTFRADLIRSPVGEAAYQLRPYEVQIGGNRYLNDHTIIQLTETTPDTEIRYTLDGSDPTQTSSLYSDQTGILITHSLPIKAVAFKSGAGWLPSTVSLKYFNVSVAPATLSSMWSDLYEPVQLICNTPGAVFHYTTDGTTPTLLSPVWSAPKDLPSNTVIRVFAEKGQMDSSTATLTVIKISSQNTRFEKSPIVYLSNVTDVVKKDSSTFYAVGLNQIWKISDGISSVFHSGGFAQIFRSIALTSDGKLAVADSGTTDVIQFLSPSNVASDRWEANPVSPFDIVPLPTGGFLMADSNSHRIQQITASGAVTLIAGNGTTGSVDGPALQAGFNRPVGIARDPAGSIYVVEQWGRRIRKIGTDNIVTTIAGSDESGWVDGPVATARFETPRALARDRIGNLYVSDEGSSLIGKIRKIRPDGTVTTLRGPIYQSGASIILSPDSLGLSFPKGLDVDENGTLYIAGNDTFIKATQEDWDNDGIPDTTEATLGAPFIVGVDDRLADADGDLFSNCAEWIAGKNALLAANVPTERTHIQLKDGTVSLNLPCEPGGTHQLEYSDDLQNWKPMGVPSTSAFRSFAARFTAPNLITQRFYRLRCGR